MKQTSKFISTVAIILSFFISNTMAQNKNNSVVKQMDRVHSEYESRIIGGHLVPRGERTFQVALLMDGYQTCGGSIIADQWVMTAAHCVDGGFTADQILSDTQKLDQGGQRHQVVQIIKHPSWGDDNIGGGNDIALIRIQDSFDNDLERVKLANNSITENALKGIVSGWGNTKVPSSTPSNELLEATQTIISDDECQKLAGNINRQSIICAYDDDKSSCNGDSGGPFTTESDGQTYSIGIVSFGPGECSGYSAYTETSNFINWIKQHVDTDSTTPPEEPTPPVEEPTPPVEPTPPDNSCPSDYEIFSDYINSDGYSVVGDDYYYANSGIHSFTSNNSLDMHLYKWNDGDWWYGGNWENVKSATSPLTYQGDAGDYLFVLTGQPEEEYSVCVKIP